MEDLSEKIQEWVENNKVEVNKGRSTQRKGGKPSEWRPVQRVKKYQPRKWSEDFRAGIFSCFREHDLQRKKGMRECETEEEEMRQQQRMKIMTDMTRESKFLGRLYANNSW